MDINEIKEILPHRYPFLLIDKVISMEGNKIIHTVWGVGYKIEK